MNQSDILEISRVITERFEEARDRYRLHRWERPVFNFQLKGRTAGQAHLSKNLININEGLFIRNKEDFLRSTLPHEVGHLAAFRAFNDRGHGNGWKKVMVDFGLEPKRCHSYDVSEVGRKTRRFLYRCGCLNHCEVPTNTHNKIKERLFQGLRAGYMCKRCKKTLEYTGVEK